MSESEQFHATVAFGWSGPKGEEKLHQLWVGDHGTLDWRMVPTIVEGLQKKRTPSIAGFIPEEDEDKA